MVSVMFDGVIAGKYERKEREVELAFFEVLET